LQNALAQNLISSSVKTAKTMSFRCFSLLLGRPLQTLKITNFGVVQWSQESFQKIRHKKATLKFGVAFYLFKYF